MYIIKDYIIKNGKYILNWKNKPSEHYKAKYVVGFTLSTWGTERCSVIFCVG